MRALRSLLVVVFFALPLGAQKVVNMTKLGQCEVGLPGSGACLESAATGMLNERAVNDVWGFETGGVEYALVGTFEGTAIYDVSSDPANPTQVQFVGGPKSGWRDIKASGDFAFVVHDLVEFGETPVGLQILDLSGLPGSVGLATYAVNFDRGHNLFVADAGATLYVTNDSDDTSGINAQGFRILDITNPTAPVEVGAYLSRKVHDVYVRNDVVYAACELDGFFFIDVTNKAAPFEIDSVTYPNQFTHNVALTDSGNYAFTTDENLGGHIRIWDVSNLSSVTQVAEYEARPDDQIMVHNVFIRGDHAFISYYTEGVVVLDITDPTQPCEIGYYDTDPIPILPGHTDADVGRGVWGVYPFTTSGQIYASDIQRGLFVLDFIPPVRPPVDVILALDISGSMNEPANTFGQTRIEVLSDAVEVFLNIWLANTVPQDRMGIVTFGSSVTSIPSGGPTVLEPFCANFQDLVSEVRGLTAGGWTAMGGGLLTAFNGFDSSSTARQEAILFTDGMQNFSPMVMEVLPSGHEIIDQPVSGVVKGDSGVPGESGKKIGDFGVDLHVIAVGVLPSYEVLLSDIAGETTDGLFHSTQSTNDFFLRQFFETDLVDALKGTTLQRIGHRTGELVQGTPVEETFSINRSIRQATFIVSWVGVRDPDALRVELISPSGFPIGLAGLERRGDIFSIVSIPFPYRLRNEVIRPEGDWIVRLSDPTDDRISYRVSVLVDENVLKVDFGPDEFLFAAGDPIPVSATVREGSAPATGSTRITVRVTRPQRSIASVFAGHPADIAALETETFGLDPDRFPSLASKRLFELRRDGLLTTDVTSKELVLHDDGQPEHGDAKEGDGIFSALFDDTGTPGRYDLAYTVKGDGPKTGPYERNAEITVRIAVLEIDPKKSDASAELVRTDPDGGRGFVARVVPRDALGNLLGPGYADRIVFDADGAAIGSSSDRLDGSYEAELRVPASSERPTWTVHALGTLVHQGELSDDERSPIFMIVVAVMVLLLLIVWIWRRSSNA